MSVVAEFWSKILTFVGTVDNPLQHAVVINVLIGHNQPIREILVKSSLDVLLTASKDNTIKVGILTNLQYLVTEHKGKGKVYTWKQLPSIRMGERL